MLSQNDDVSFECWILITRKSFDYLSYVVVAICQMANTMMIQTVITRWIDLWKIRMRERIWLEIRSYQEKLSGAQPPVESTKLYDNLKQHSWEWCLPTLLLNLLKTNGNQKPFKSRMVNESIRAGANKTKKLWTSFKYEIKSSCFDDELISGKFECAKESD